MLPILDGKYRYDAFYHIVEDSHGDERRTEAWNPRHWARACVKVIQALRERQFES